MSETWLTIAKGNLDAAGALIDSGCVRSAINRSYFAAFAAVSHRLTQKGLTFSEGRESPSHELLRKLVQDHLMPLGRPGA